MNTFKLKCSCIAFGSNEMLSYAVVDALNKKGLQDSLRAALDSIKIKALSCKKCTTSTGLIQILVESLSRSAQR